MVDSDFLLTFVVTNKKGDTSMRTTEFDFEKAGYQFRYFFDADVDEMCHQDVEGYEVYEDGEYVTELFYITKEEIEAMTDEDLYDLICKNM